MWTNLLKILCGPTLEPTHICRCVVFTLSMVNWSALQADVGDWAEENFGDQPATNPFLGTAEELSELVAYLLENDVSAGSKEELDAVGDILVFFADYCARREFDAEFDSAYQAAADYASSVSLHTDCETLEDLCVELTISRGNQAYSLLKQDQGIRLERDGVGPKADVRYLGHTLKALDTFATSRGYTLDEAVDEAWGEVQDREWDSSYN